MLSFLSDYTEGAHPEVLQHLLERNLVTLPGYGFDEDTDEAKRKINAACGRDDHGFAFLRFADLGNSGPGRERRQPQDSQPIGQSRAGRIDRP